MNTIFDVLLSPRFKSFYWRTLMMAIAGFVSIVAANLDLFHLSVQATTIAGLILGELAKALNNYNQGQSLGFARR